MFFLFIAFACSYLVYGREAVVTADSVTSQTVKVQNEIDATVILEGNVNIKGDNFVLNTQKAIMHKKTRDFDIPSNSKVEYTGADEKITVYSSQLFANPANKTLKGKNVAFVSEVASYKAKDVDVKNGIADFDDVKFSTCAMFNEDKSECGTPWHGSATKLNYNYNSKYIRAKHFVMYLHGVPVFYTPYLKLSLDKNKDGFQKFKLINPNNQRGITFNYVKTSKQYGEFVITPEIYLNSSNSNAILARQHNMQVVHRYSGVNSFVAQTDVKVAPNSYIPSGEGAATQNKGTRYYIMTENAHGKENYSFSSGVQISSDRLFRRVYNNNPINPTENYFISHFDFFNFNQKNQAYGVETKYYTPMTANNQNTIPSVVSSAKYSRNIMQKQRSYVATANAEVLNFQRQSGVSGTRFKTNIDTTKVFTHNELQVQTNANLNLYNYSYRNTELNPQYLDAQRIVADSSINASRVFVYSYQDYVTQVKPILFVDYTTAATRNDVKNEDSTTTFVTDTNVMLSSKFSGYDIVDRGFKFAYGVDIKARDLLKKKKFDLFVAQRYNTIGSFSDYVGRAGASWNGYNLTSRIILNRENSSIKYSNTNILMPVFKFVDLGFGYFFINKNLSNTVADIENYKYSAKIKYNSHFIFSDILQNPKFLTTNDKTENVISGISGGVGYESKCLFYRIGLQRQMTFTGVQTIMNNIYILEFRVTM